MDPDHVFSQQPDEILAQYDHGLMVSGHGKDFFARERIKLLRRLEPAMTRVPLGAQYAVFATADKARPSRP